MDIQFKKIVDESKNNRVEFLLLNFDFYDGIEWIAKILCQEYPMDADEIIDGIWYKTINLHEGETIYTLVWHEDVGNFLYCSPQDERTINELEQRLKFAFTEI